MTRTPEEALAATRPIWRGVKRVALCAAGWTGIALIIIGDAVVAAWIAVHDDIRARRRPTRTPRRQPQVIRR